MLPDRPVNLRYEDGALTWDPPTAEGDFPVQGYLLSWRNVGDFAWRKVRIGGAVTSRTYRPRYDGEYCVHAESEAGISDESSPCLVSVTAGGKY